MENVFRDQKYNEWLNRSTSVGNENDKLTISKMQEANQILSERLRMVCQRWGCVMRKTLSTHLEISSGKIHTHTWKISGDLEIYRT